MADTSKLSNFLEDIADAIRTKKETTDKIPAENFDTEILSIEGGIDTSDATATAMDIAEGKTAYVNGEKIEGQIMSVESISAWGREITYNEELQRLSMMEPIFPKVMFNQPQGIVILSSESAQQVADAIGLTSDKLVSGNTILGVEGTAEMSSGVKLFETTDEMQADETAKEGDLAVVYSTGIRNVRARDVLTEAMIPAEITFPEGMTIFDDIRRFYPREYPEGYDYIMFDIDTLGLPTAVVRYTEETTDGDQKCFEVTYTRNDEGVYIGTIERNDFDVTLDTETNSYIVTFKCPLSMSADNQEYWEESFGYFAQTNLVAFDGVYTYVSLESKYLPISTGLSVTTKDVLDGVAAYGDNGVIIGTMQVPKYQTKTITYNGIFYPTEEAGYTGFSEVTVNVPTPMTEEEYDTALSTTADILGGGAAIGDVKLASMNTCTFPNTAFIPEVKGLSEDFGTRINYGYLNDAGDTEFLNPNDPFPFTTAELLEMYPYYAVIIRTDMMMCFFSDIDWIIRAEDNELQLINSVSNNFDANIGEILLEALDVITTDTITLEDMRHLSVEMLFKSVSGGSGGLSYTSTDSIAIYGNVKIEDNTTNKIFS